MYFSLYSHIDQLDLWVLLPSLSLAGLPKSQADLGIFSTSFLAICLPTKKHKSYIVNMYCLITISNTPLKSCASEISNTRPNMRWHIKYTKFSDLSRTKGSQGGGNRVESNTIALSNYSMLIVL
jgi:hypothetical protein